MINGCYSPQIELAAFRERLESLRSVLHSNRTVKPHPSPVPMMAPTAAAAKARKSNGGPAAAVDNAVNSAVASDRSVIFLNVGAKEILYFGRIRN